MEHGITPQSIVKQIDEVMSSVYERDYLTPAATIDGTERFHNQQQLDAHIVKLQDADEGGRGEPRLRKGRGAPRRHQTAAQPRARACRGPRGGRDRRVLPFIENWLKKAALEVQEYVRLRRRGVRAASFTAPLYRYDIVEQFDVDRRRLADRRAADRLLHRRRARAAERPDAGSVRRRGRWSAGWSARR